MNDAVTISDDAKILLGEWHRDADGKVVAVICDCNYPIYYRRKVHSRLVDPDAGTARCKRCKSWVRVPVRFCNH